MITLISRLLPYAISIKIAPSNIYIRTYYSEYELIAKPCSNPVFALNNGYELTMTLNKQFDIIDNHKLFNWIGTDTAKQRLINYCYPTEICKPRMFLDVVYQTCFNPDGIHIFNGQCSWNSWYYSSQKSLGQNISVYLGFSNKTECNKIINNNNNHIITINRNI